MSESFSTNLVPAGDRREAWHWRARQICGECRFQFPKLPAFHGTIDSRDIGDSSLAQFSSSPLAFAKIPRFSRQSENSSYIVISQLRGVRRYLQANAAAVLRPGDTTIIDSSLPWSSDCAEECARLYLRVPRWRMENHLQTKDPAIARRIAGRAGLGATLFRLATSLYQEGDRFSPEESAASLEAYLSILAACLGMQRKEASLSCDGEGLFTSIERYIEKHLADATLGPCEIAAEAGISVRHLHRLFARRGCTVGEWIRWRRLQQCRSALADPRLHMLTITDVAFHWGFSESAHFSRSFKKQFGLSPRTFRSLAASKAWPAKTLREDFAASGAEESNSTKPN